MTHDEIINAWNKQADYMNKWNYLGEDEKLEWAMRLEREACAKVVEECDWPKWAEPTDARDVFAEAIRARGQA